MEKTKLFSFIEHKIISDGSLNDCLEIIYNDYDPNNPNKYLGLNCCNHKNKTFQTNYYIGLDWIVEGESAIMVEPKIKGLNYLKMFMDCFDCDNIIAKEKLKDIYHIDFGRDPIKVKNNTFELTPLLIIHFIKLMQSLTKRNLKKDYIQVEENFNSKIKGKILFSKNVKYNVFKGREDRFYCKYQDYSSDCIENRILKKTLRYVQKYLDNNSISIKHEELDVICNSCLAVFEHVSDDLTIQQIKQFKVNPLFKEYSESLKVAKLILKRFSYSIDNATNEIDKSLPPFWIDMPLLFEVYVLTLLQKRFKNEIEYQVKGNYGRVDYIRKNSPLIIDAKYKPIYSDIFTQNEDEDELKFEKSVSGRFKIEDIRQLSGYARDKKILSKLGIKGNNVIVPCLIVYPLDKSQYDIQIKKSSYCISSFVEFYKLGIRLPQM
ncbi:MAG: hypothetical protein H6Q15_980 [Bacteroidetes bacterium]|nr:hypothetical protein [Bacteroidota bacterium]